MLPSRSSSILLHFLLPNGPGCVFIFHLNPLRDAFIFWPGTAGSWDSCGTPGGGHSPASVPYGGAETEPVYSAIRPHNPYVKYFYLPVITLPLFLHVTLWRRETEPSPWPKIFMFSCRLVTCPSHRGHAFTWHFESIKSFTLLCGDRQFSQGYTVRTINTRTLVRDIHFKICRQECQFTNW